MRSVYSQRLLEALRGINEVDVQDKMGNIVLSRGLKIRHTDSGYEYTVGAVDPESKTVELLSPETPRFPVPVVSPDTAPGMSDASELLDLLRDMQSIMQSNSRRDEGSLRETDDKSMSSSDENPEVVRTDSEVLTVTFADLSKNYEVSE
jgi:hypothetical protein